MCVRWEDDTNKKAMGRLEKSPLLITSASLESVARNIGWLPRILRQAVARSIASNIAGLLLVSTSAFFTCFIAMLDKGDTLKLIPVETLFWRSLVSWLLTLVAITASGVKMHVKVEFCRALVLRCVTGCTVLITTTLVLQKLAVSNATAITYIGPVLTYILATVLLHEKPGMFAGACSVMCVSGAVLVVRPRFLFGMDGSTDTIWYNRSMTSVVTSYLFGESLALGCAVFVVLMQTGAHLSLRSLRKVPHLVVMHFFLLATTLALLAVMLCSQHGKIKAETSFEAWGAISCTGVFAFLEQLFLTRGFHFDAAGVLAATRLLPVGYQFAWDTILLDTGINPYSAGGATAITVGVIVLVLRRVQMHRAAWS